jgi:hypothetical protein
MGCPDIEIDTAVEKGVPKYGFMNNKGRFECKCKCKCKFKCKCKCFKI